MKYYIYLGGIKLPEPCVMPCVPTLWVKKLEPSAKWFKEVLGFSSVYERENTEGEPILIHLRKGMNQDLLLAPDPDGFAVNRKERGLGMTLTFIVEDDIDDLAGDVWSNGGEIVSGPAEEPWNVRDVVIKDPNGYRIRLSQMTAAGSSGEVLKMVSCCR